MLARVLTCLCCLALLACSDKPADGRPVGGDFVLRSADGPFDTHAFRGKLLLIFFGYTHCPDICPASMAAGAQALNNLTPDERKKVKLVLVSVDPQRDTLAHLKQYASFFHPEMLGVTGSADEVAQAARAYGAAYRMAPPDASGNYAVDHTSNTYLVDADGRLAEILTLGIPMDDYVAAIRKHLP